MTVRKEILKCKIKNWWFSKVWLISKSWRRFFPMFLLMLFVVSLMNSSVVGALTQNYSFFGMRLRYYDGSSYTGVSNLLYDMYVGGVERIDRVVTHTLGIEGDSNANFMVVTAKWNLVTSIANAPSGTYYYQAGADPNIFTISTEDGSLSYEQDSVSVFQTDWNCSYASGNPDPGLFGECRTFTYEVTFIVRNPPARIADLTIGVEYPQSLRVPDDYIYYPSAVWFEDDSLNRLKVDYLTDTDQIANAIAQQQLQAQQNANDIAQRQLDWERQQYESEKREESQREQSAQDSADQLGGMFNFTVPNPVAGLLGMFSPPDGCVNIPIIASMVGSTDTQYCPWFPASVRNILTPVIGLISVVFIFGFIVAWLNGNDANGSITIKGGIH